MLHLLDHNLLVSSNHQLVAPNAIRSEAMQLLLDDVRRGQRTEQAALETHERLTGLKMRLLGDRASRAVALANRPSARLGDTTRRRIPGREPSSGRRFVTIDRNLADRADGIVAVAPLRALFEAG